MCSHSQTTLFALKQPPHRVFDGSYSQKSRRSECRRPRTGSFARFSCPSCCSPPPRCFAQQTGEILGTVKDTAGAVLPGVTVQATSNVLPRARETVSSAGGEYRLPALPPGTYTLTFSLSGMQTVTRTAQVLLAQQTRADATLGVAGITEAVTVTAEVSLIDKDSATIKSSIASQEIMGLPVGQEYRDLQKLIPGVQYSQDTVPRAERRAAAARTTSTSSTAST